jgi:type II secretory pathway predicted ATPase ExeA/tetratricopeptide (TPR) repeat protein
MYLSFYKVKEKPFTINTDPRFLWYGEKHREALANLTYGLMEENGYVVMTGEAGTGKTTLVNALIETLDENVLVTKINHPTFGADEFLYLVAKSYDSTLENAGKADCWFIFKSFLQQAHAEGKTALLIIDEAHRLPKASLEEIRLLSNIEHAHKKLINIFLVGQKELKLTLSSPECDALRQRITLFYDIQPLSEDETRDYVVHRLKVAGTEERLFTLEAIHQIQNFTRGYPRLINIICDRAMLTGYLREQKKIDADIVSECVREISFIGPTASDTEIIKIDKYLTQDRPAVAGSWIHKEDHENSARVESNSVWARVRAKTVKNATYQKATTLLAKKNQLMLTAIGLLAVIVLVVFARSIDFKLGSKLRTVASGPVDRTTPEETASFAARRDALAGLQQATDNAVSVSETPVQHAPEAATKLQRQQPAEEIMAYNEEHAPASPKPTIVASPSLKKTASREAKPNEQEKPATTESAALTPKKTANAFRPTTLELATVALKQQDFRTAIELFEADRSPDAQKSPKARELYSEALTGRAGQIMERSPLEAETMIRKAVEADPKNIRAYFNLGKIYTQTKKYAQAIDAYLNVVALNPNLSDAFFNLGFIYATTGNYKEAESVFARVVQLMPTYLDKALFNLALVQERLGKKQESLANLKKALTVRPENKKVQAYLKQVEIGAQESP